MATSAMHHVASTILQNPVFEGSEKRLEIDFTDGPAGGLRNLPRAALDELMELAACTIVSSRSNDTLDAYVLSESSLFVYSHKWVLKTCGTTQLLKAVPRLIELTTELGLKAAHCKYTRASFLFPENQPFPHTGFTDETQFLDKALAPVLGGGLSSVLGEEADGLQWHIYVAGDANVKEKQPTMNFEVCMTELDPVNARQFFRCDKFISTKQTTADSGILNIKPSALIDDYVFEPCGYSMNGIEGGGHMTIHVTPEPGFSYASFELSGHTDDIGSPSEKLQAAVSIFKPARLTVAMATNCETLPKDFGSQFKPPANYTCSVVHSSQLPGGGCVNYVTMTSVDSRPVSPRTVLGHAASSQSMATITEGDSSSSDPDTPMA
eukprot:gene5249-18480_t